MTITLITVATVDSLIMNLEKDFCPPGPVDWLNAMRFAIKPATFKLNFLSVSPTESATKISR